MGMIMTGMIVTAAAAARLDRPAGSASVIA